MIDELATLEKKLAVLEMTLNERLQLAEGNILNLQMSHRGHVNYNPVEFANMHGYRIENLKNLTSPVDGLPAGVSEYCHPDAFQSRSKMIHYAMQFADEMSYQIRTDEDGDATVTAQALVTGLVELAGLKLEVG